MVTVYILKSKTKNWYYTGITTDLERRFKEHQKGKCSTTKNYLPLHILHTEECPDFPSARKREKFFKSKAGRKWRKENLE